MGSNLSKHFTVAELTVTSTGIKNNPDNSMHWENLHATAYGMECVRAILGDAPIHVTSAYRNYKVNAAVGGVKNSDHTLGYAVDFRHSKLSAQECCRRIAESFLPFHQLILERKDTLVHISFNPNLKRQLMRQYGGPGTPIEAVKRFAVGL